MSVVGFHCSAGGSPASPPPFTTRLSPLHVLGSSVEHELCVCARVCVCAVEVGAPLAQRPHLDRRSDPGSEARAAPWAGRPQGRRGGQTEPRAPPSGALAFNPSPPLGAARPTIFRRQHPLSGSSCMQWRRRRPLTLVWGGAWAAGPAEAGTPRPGEPSAHHGHASVLRAFAHGPTRSAGTPARALGFWFSKGLTTRVRTHTHVHTRAQPCTRTDLREQLPVSVTASPKHETSAQRTRAFGQRLSRDWKPFPRTACVRAPGMRPRRPSTLHAVKAPARPRKHTHRRNDAGRLGEEEERRHIGSESSSCLKCNHYRFCAKAVCSVLLQILANSYNKEGTAPDASIDPRLAIIIAAS